VAALPELAKHTSRLVVGRVPGGISRLPWTFLCADCIWTARGPLIASGQRGGETFFSNPWLAVTILTAAGSAMAGGVVAGIAIFRKRERSFFSFVALLLGILVAVFMIGEIAIPH